MPVALHDSELAAQCAVGTLSLCITHSVTLCSSLTVTQCNRYTVTLRSLLTVTLCSRHTVTLCNMHPATLICSYQLNCWIRNQSNISAELWGWLSPMTRAVLLLLYRQVWLNLWDLLQCKLPLIQPNSNFQQPKTPVGMDSPLSCSR